MSDCPHSRDVRQKALPRRSEDRLPVAQVAQAVGVRDRVCGMGRIRAGEPVTVVGVARLRAGQVSSAAMR
jgi:hypothetical protein